ncbi:carbon-phosphorus lyase complex subunit PhnI [Spongiactinospora sp. TRM90649]|uniref:carbon-phosphorus lyase complex subunit PhnI n=1 Tax=Spongiactinospora sp. TRM90649 TaxID=3031114 RepID=UPI0023F7C588|nr:carbon-phosphorus lyase complex subunit PhnI [Spongiactinospora sp. TRM90649]MDF5757072.1 carbon-phosphorus lyase complex subunit PhnI [Spongiactinospora sp. TRM90649]
MGFSNARGGTEAILAAERLVRRSGEEAGSDRITLAQLTERMGLAVDRVMGEGGLWAPELAARALRQAEGDVMEAAQLLRAHRSSIPRLAYSEVASTDDLRVVRRISSAFRNPPGRQLLGRTTDYVGRLLDLMPEDEPGEGAAPESHAHGHDHAHDRDHARDHDHAHPHVHDEPVTTGADALRHPPRLAGLLREMDLVVDRRPGPDDADPEPFDITRAPARPGAPRSAVLASMARAETGALVNLWYAYTFSTVKHGHEIPGEVRHGWLPVKVAHPATGEPVTVAEIRVTEVETIDDLDRPEEDRTRLDLGYGLCFGHNERKAIAMAGLDLLVHRDGGRTELEQRVLITLDGIEACGFLEHLKLPHYVDFRSLLDRKRAVRNTSADGGPR